MSNPEDRGMIRRHDESRVVSDLSVLGNSIIRPSLMESRRVTIGKKGEQVRNARDGGTWRAPVKLDHFLVTLCETDEKMDYVVDWKFHREILKDDKPRRIPITLIFNRIQLSAMTYLGLYAGRSAWCKGDGEVARRLDDMRFQFKLPGMGIGECAVFRSTGKHTISVILGSLHLIKEAVSKACRLPFDDAPIADLPLILEYHKKTVPDAEGKTRIIPVINVKCMLTPDEIYEKVFGRPEYARKSKDDILKLLAMDTSAEAVQARDQQAKLLAPETEKEAAAINEEFHPELVEGKPADVGPCKARQDADELKRMEDAAKKVLPSSVIDAMADVEDDDLDQPPQPAPQQQKPKVQAAPAPRPTPQKPKEDGDWL
jgi:hypothetical protein